MTHAPARSALALCALAIAGCRGEGKRDDAPAPAVPSASAAEAPKPKPLVDLLHYTDADVAVSSNVDNPKDYPEHLIDGKPETAWNGKTGDLVGGWVAFRLPPGVRVRRIELSAGFDKVSNKGDLFAMNHRVKRVRVLHRDKPVAERDLDPNQRAPQPVDLDGTGGGDYRVEVLAVEPGTKASWRELALSEFKVWGDPGPNKLERPRMPQVGVGTFPRRRPAVPPPADVSKGLFDRPYPSLDAFCREYSAKLTPAIDAAFPGDRYPGRVEGPHCRARAALAAGFVPAEWAQGVVLYDADDERVDFSSFAVKTPDGVVPSHVRFSEHGHDDPGCSGGQWSQGHKARFEGGRLHVTSIRVRTQRSFPVYDETGLVGFNGPRTDVTKVDVVCSFGGGRLDCAETELASACYDAPDYELPAAPAEPDWTHRCASPAPE